MPEPSPPIPPQPLRVGPSTARGIRWSLVVAEMAKDEALRQRRRDGRPSLAAPPVPVVKSTPAGDEITVPPTTDLSGVPWLMRWAC
jgi:hypothetical protein